MALKKNSNATPVKTRRLEDVVPPESFQPDAPRAVVKKPRRRKVFSMVFNVLMLLIIAGLGYAYYANSQELVTLKKTEAGKDATQKEIASIEDELRKIVLLPEDGEVPQLLPIDDASAAVNQQPSLEGVVNGDRILLYAKNAKAYIYSPSRKILVNILPLAYQSASTQTAATGTSPQATSSTTTDARAADKKAPEKTQ